MVWTRFLKHFFEESRPDAVKSTTSKFAMVGKRLNKQYRLSTINLDKAARKISSRGVPIGATLWKERPGSGSSRPDHEFDRPAETDRCCLGQNQNGHHYKCSSSHPQSSRTRRWIRGPGSSAAVYLEGNQELCCQISHYTASHALLQGSSAPFSPLPTSTTCHISSSHSGVYETHEQRGKDQVQLRNCLEHRMAQHAAEQPGFQNQPWLDGVR